MGQDIHVKGLAELSKRLQEFPQKLEKNILRSSLRAGAKEVLPVAQSKIHNVSGELAKGLKVGTRARGGIVTAFVKTSGPHGFIGRFLEFQVRPHEIQGKFGGSLFLGGVFRKVVMHPGWAAGSHAFLRPALDQQATAAVNAAAAYMKMRIEKQGIDVADAQVEGDESAGAGAGASQSRPAGTQRSTRPVKSDRERKDARNAAARLRYIGSKKR